MYFINLCLVQNLARTEHSSSSNAIALRVIPRDANDHDPQNEGRSSHKEIIKVVCSEGRSSRKEIIKVVCSEI
jgi:hypothetical protein